LRAARDPENRPTPRRDGLAGGRSYWQEPDVAAIGYEGRRHGPNMSDILREQRQQATASGLRQREHQQAEGSVRQVMDGGTLAGVLSFHDEHAERLADIALRCARFVHAQ